MLEDGQGFVLVKRVVWANDRDYDCWVQLICEDVTDIKAT